MLVWLREYALSPGRFPVSYVLDRPRPKRRVRGETVGVIVLTVFLAVSGAALTAVAVSLTSNAPAIGAMIR
jgi:hypothetical protein